MLRTRLAVFSAPLLLSLASCGAPETSDDGGIGAAGPGVGGAGTASGGAAAGGALATGGTPAVGGQPSSGGSGPGTGGEASGGSSSAGGASAGVGGDSTSSGGSSSGGGTPGVGGSPAAGGAGTGGGGPISTDCEFTISKNEVSSKMATVGNVEWALAGAAPTSAKIVYTLDGAAASLLNKGGEAPVDLSKANFKTLLLGLKQSSNYTFHIEANRAGETCVSEDFALPKTGTLSAGPNVTVNVAAADKREPGFIVTSTGFSMGGGGGSPAAFILDADGAVVWAAAGPADNTRAQMDYEGANMWMLELNVSGTGGEMRYISMDGQTSQNNVSGLANAHHDFTVMPGGKVAAMLWTNGGESESNLVIRSPDGTLTTAFKIGSNLYSSGSYHCNAIHYVPEDDSFTISDRNPNLFVKVSSSGDVQWQLGGSCSNAPAGTSKCSAQSWKVNHGHHLLSDGTFVLFNNGQSGNAHIFEFDVTATSNSMTAALVKDYTGTAASSVLGDVQRLPNGNTLITYSSGGKMIEVDESWAVVQTFSGAFGYANWRPSLYGPPTRL